MRDVKQQHLAPDIVLPIIVTVSQDYYVTRYKIRESEKKISLENAPLRIIIDYGILGLKMSSLGNP